MKIYFNSYKPLIGKPPGRKAVAAYKIPPFVDGSCRREPDFQSSYPSISALCRGQLFAPRLREGDIVVYITTKGRHLGVDERHWRLVAILEVLKRFGSHKDAAIWYRSQDLPLPSNCMVAGNPPLPLDMTNRNPDAGAAASCGAVEDEDCRSPSDGCGDVGRTSLDPLEAWDRRYLQRALDCGVFLACTVSHLELYNPPTITDATIYAVFGRVPGTRNPGTITPAELHRLKKACGI